MSKDQGLLCYQLFPGSGFSWLGDNSGIALYNSYNGDTHFLNAVSSDDSEVTFQQKQLHTPFSINDLMHWLNLTESQAKHVCNQLVMQHVLWEEV